MDSSSISITALYTGQIWYEHGLSAKFLTSPTSKLMYQILKPVEFFAEKLVGVNIRDLLLQRHVIMDHRIRQLIETEGVCQILEIASGLSPRGHTFSKEFPHLHYVEADLPDMASRKHKLLRKENALSPNYKVVTCNFFETGGPSGLDYVIDTYLDNSKPTIIITEGLVNYFDLQTISNVWKKIQQLTNQFPSAWYMTDLVPRLQHESSYKYARLAELFMRGVVRANVNLHYGSDQEIVDGFQACGFAETRVHHPEDYYASLDIPQTRSESLIRVVESRISQEKPRQGMTPAS